MDHFSRTKLNGSTKETYDEQDEYFSFQKIVMMFLQAYTERGGDIKESEISNKKLDENKIYMKNFDGDLFVSEGRLPCEQPFQRMLITYDGRVSMCCYDWGSMHPIGYTDDLAIKTGDEEFVKIKEQADRKKKGFELMNLKLPEKFNNPSRKFLPKKKFEVRENKVRKLHLENKLEKVISVKNAHLKIL